MNHRVWIEHESGGEWVEGLWMRGDLWVHFRGVTRKIEASSKSFGKAGGGRSKEDVSAPMPGKITKLLAQKGAKVQAGDVMVVMEAMKMEYSLKADVSGEITKIECKVGDQVSLGKVLVHIKAEAE